MPSAAVSAVMGEPAAAPFLPDQPDAGRAEQDARERYMAGQSVMKAGGYSGRIGWSVCAERKNHPPIGLTRDPKGRYRVAGTVSNPALGS